MKVLVRADAGLIIGTGHVRRCLTLLDAITNAQATFVCRDHPGHLAAEIEGRGYACRLLPLQATASGGYAPWLGAPQDTDAADAAIIADSLGGVDVLITDHYAIGRDWQRTLRPHAKVILAIDDLADRDHDADVLLDQTFGRAATAYRDLVPPSCRIMTGSEYALLRPQFAALRPQALARRAAFDKVRRVLVAMGGTDSANLAERAVTLLGGSRQPDTLAVTVVVPDGKRDQTVKQTAALGLKADVLANVADMARLMMEADAAIGATGTSTWERCCLGLPTLSIIVAENQRQAASLLVQAKVVYAAVQPHDLTADLIRGFLTMGRPAYKQLCAQAAAICDGTGVERVVRELGL